MNGHANDANIFGEMEIKSARNTDIFGQSGDSMGIF